MLSDEEREAVKLLNDMIKNKPDTIRLEWRKGIYALQIILNLIEKQQKEIEEVKNADLTTVYLNGFYDGEKKVEDKIKAKIDEVCESTIEESNVDILYSLLEKE